jgi:hypothetical protein
MPAPQDVIDAWADIADWVQNTMPGLAQEESLPDETQDAGDIGACNSLNVDPSSGAVWGSDGDTTVTLTALKIASVAGVTIQPGTAPGDGTVHLPFSFKTLEVQGNYSYGQPCACYDMGKKVSTTTYSGTGTITQTISNNTLYYVANVGDTLTLSSVVVGGDPSVSVNPDNGGMPDWLVKIADFFSTFHEADALRSTLQNVFLTAQFSATMISLLEQHIGESS